MIVLDRNAPETTEIIRASDTAKVVEIISERLEKFIDDSKYLLNTSIDTPIEHIYNITVQLKDAEYSIKGASGEEGDIMHGINLSNDSGIGIRGVIDSMDLFLGQFRRVMHEPDFNDSTPISLAEAHELENTLGAFFKAMHICQELAARNIKD